MKRNDDNHRNLISNYDHKIHTQSLTDCIFHSSLLFKGSRSRQHLTDSWIEEEKDDLSSLLFHFFEANKILEVLFCFSHSQETHDTVTLSFSLYTFLIISCFQEEPWTASGANPVVSVSICLKQAKLTEKFWRKTILDKKRERKRRREKKEVKEFSLPCCSFHSLSSSCWWNLMSLDFVLYFFLVMFFFVKQRKHL